MFLIHLFLYAGVYCISKGVGYNIISEGLQIKEHHPWGGGGGGGGGRGVDTKRNGLMKGKVTVLQSLHRLPQQT